MAYRNIVISSSVKLSVKNNQLEITGDAEGSVPIEDIRTLLIENKFSTISTYALSFLAENGVCVYFCDEKHLPCAVLMPFAQHTRQKKQIELQFSQTKPKLKSMWSEIVIAKIINQSKCLEYCGKDEKIVSTLKNLTKKILSGDTSNIEGQAAVMYFPALFGENFTRNDEDDINSALNYGYAIIRGYICRTLAKYGYETSVGIHHCSQLNNFNFADDIIEPFRPIVDMFVAKKCIDSPFDRYLKLQLVNILNYEILFGKEKHSVAYAIELMVQSIGKVFLKEKEHLTLPTLTNLKIHEYE